MKYGYCKCGAPVTQRTRGLPPLDTCQMGHVRLARHTMACNPIQSFSVSTDDLPPENTGGYVYGVPVYGEFETYGPKTLTLEEKIKAAGPGPIMVSREEPDKEKFVSPCPPPSQAHAEILDILIEECAEVIQRATKMKRFGVKEVQPGQPLDNADRLSEEVGDLKAILSVAMKEGLIREKTVNAQIPRKFEKLGKYMQTYTVTWFPGPYIPTRREDF